MQELKENKFNIIIDGQFGSTGKGLFGGYIALENNIDIYVSNLSPNAGHTCQFEDGRKIIAKQLPIGGILNKRSTIYLTPGSIINPKLFLEEIEKFGIDPTRVFIHPRSAIIEEDDINHEKNLNSSVSKIASTQSGVGKALSRKVNREAKLADNISSLKKFIKEIDLMNLMDMGCTALMETSQGFDLDIDYGLSYPHCTSRNVNVSKAIADSGVHPDYLGSVLMCIRSYPIRVGHLYDELGNIVGDSGPFYQDSRELTWEELDEIPEKTTVTKKVRRIATFSEIQYQRAIYYLRPTHIFLNFSNYIKTKKYSEKLLNIFKNNQVPTHLGFGPNIDDIYRVKNLKQIKELLNVNISEREREKYLIRKRV